MYVAKLCKKYGVEKQTVRKSQKKYGATSCVDVCKGGKGVSHKHMKTSRQSLHDAAVMKRYV